MQGHTDIANDDPNQINHSRSAPSQGRAILQQADPATFDAVSSGQGEERSLRQTRTGGRIRDQTNAGSAFGPVQHLH